MNAATPPTPPLIGPGTQLAARYRLRSLIGRGGVGQVWQADDTRLDRRVAVKTLTHDVDEDVQRFEREVRTLATLNHPSIVTIHDAGEHDGTAYLVMELVEGASLADELADGPLDPDRAVRIAASVADGLAVAHTAGIIHRDVKPGNILLDTDGTAKLADFGIARLAEAATTTVTMVGTAAYLAPEQLEVTELTPAVDVYALGLVLLEMLTGQRAFQGTGPAAAYARLSRDPHLPHDVPHHLGELLGRMTARDPAARPSASDVAARLDGRSAPDPTLPLAEQTRTVRLEPIPTRPPDRGRPRANRRATAGRSQVPASLRRWWRSELVRWAAAGAAVVLAIVLAVVVAVMATTAGPPADPGADTQPEPRQQLPAPLDDALRRLEQEINR